MGLLRLDAAFDERQRLLRGHAGNEAIGKIDEWIVVKLRCHDQKPPRQIVIQLLRPDDDGHITRRLLSQGVAKRVQVEFRHHPPQKKTQMPFTQHIPHTRRQQIRLVRVVIQKFAHRIPSLGQYKGCVNPSSHTDSEARPLQKE